MKFDKEAFREAVRQDIIKDEKCLDNGRNKLAQIVNHLSNVDYLDDEHIAYFEKNYPFSRQDYSDVFRYLEQRAGDRIKSGKADIFPEYLAYFNLGGTRFVWRLLIGQGSACQLLRDKNDHDIPYDESLETKLQYE